MIERGLKGRPSLRRMMSRLRSNAKRWLAYLQKRLQAPRASQASWWAALVAQPTRSGRSGGGPFGLRANQNERPRIDTLDTLVETGLFTKTTGGDERSSPGLQRNSNRSHTADHRTHTNQTIGSAWRTQIARRLCRAVAV